MKYTKPAVSAEDQLKILTQRKLLIEDRQEALHFLECIGYYRLSAYFRPYQDDKDFFIDGTTMSHILDLYFFDKALRTITMEGLESIEITIRTQIANYLAEKHHDPFAHLKSKYFLDRFNFKKWITDLDIYLKRSKEDFAKHFKQKYFSDTRPPIWMSFQLISFGDLSIMFANGLKREDKTALAEFYDIHCNVLSSWLHALVFLRNLCAHHARIWNREFSVSPKIPKNKNTFDALSSQGENAKFFHFYKVISYMLGKITLQSNWEQRVNELIKANLTLPQSHMGFEQECELID